MKSYTSICWCFPKRSALHLWVPCESWNTLISHLLLTLVWACSFLRLHRTQLSLIETSVLSIWELMINGISGNQMRKLLPVICKHDGYCSPLRSKILTHKIRIAEIFNVIHNKVQVQVDFQSKLKPKYDIFFYFILLYVVIIILWDEIKIATTYKISYFGFKDSSGYTFHYRNSITITALS